MSVYYTKLVKSGIISMPDIVRLCVQNPSKAIGESAGEIKVGSRVNAMLFNPNTTFKMQNKLSLYCGEELYGRVEKIFN